jgi:type IV pilus assembly protein PilA
MKTCPRCSASLQDGVSFCPSCGNNVTGAAVGSVAQSLPPSARMPYSGPQENSGKAIASLICGLLFFVPFAFVAAVILGHLAYSEIKKSAGRLKGQGLAIAGLVLGYGYVLFIPFLLIIAAIAIPNLLRARMAANEASAVGTLRIYNTAMVTYATRCPNIGFPESAKDLGPGVGNCQAANLLDAFLAEAEPVRSGYRFFYAPAPVDADGHILSYTIIADPVTQNTTGVRHFFVDQSGVIRVSEDGQATADSTPLM